MRYIGLCRSDDYYILYRFELHDLMMSSLCDQRKYVDIVCGIGDYVPIFHCDETLESNDRLPGLSFPELRSAL